MKPPMPKPTPKHKRDPIPADVEAKAAAEAPAVPHDPEIVKAQAEAAGMAVSETQPELKPKAIDIFTVDRKRPATDRTKGVFTELTDWQKELWDEFVRRDPMERSSRKLMSDLMASIAFLHLSRRVGTKYHIERDDWFQNEHVMEQMQRLNILPCSLDDPRYRKQSRRKTDEQDQ